MLARFKRYVTEQHLIPDGTAVLLAVSGGRDSVAMADLFHRADIPFEVAHCNFNLRPGDCDRDETFVHRLADHYGVPCHVAHFDTRAYAAEHGMSIEEAARHLRYHYFAIVSGGLAAGKIPVVATAHHADDSIETFFLNLFRGTGIHGLHGILPASIQTIKQSGNLTIKVIRPMLCFSRADIDAYVAERGLEFVEDYTNAELDARRNRIRHQLMPLLRELYPNVDATMLANMERLHSTELLLDAYIDQLRAQYIKPYVSILPATHYQLPPIEAIDLSAEPFRETALQSTILFELLRLYGFNAATVADITKAIKQSDNQAISGRLFYSPTHVAELHRGQLLIATIPAPSIQTFNETSLQQPSILNSQFSIRPWRPGDRFRPKGMRGTRLVSDFLKDLHLSRIEKQYVRVRVDDSNRILAVVGLRDAEQ